MSRPKREKELAKKLAKELAAQSKELRDLLGNPPDLANISDKDWARFADALSTAISPGMIDYYLDAAHASAEVLGTALDDALMLAAAAAWAGPHVTQIVTGANQYTQAAIGKLIDNAYLLKDEIGPLSDKELSAFFDSISYLGGPQRAGKIAITELTGAFMAGVEETQVQTSRQGIRSDLVWYTMNDERVCSICGPRHGLIRGDGWFDPSPPHPNCRCEVELRPILEIEVELV